MKMYYRDELRGLRMGRGFDEIWIEGHRLEECGIFRRVYICGTGKGV